MERIDPQIQREVRKAIRQNLIARSEEIDKQEGWIILKRFKNKTELAAYANDADNLADLEYRYPLKTYRRKIDLDNLYMAVLRR